MLVAIDFFLALVIGVLLTQRGRRIRPDLQSAWRAIELSALICFLADWILLAELPFLDHSFGQVGSSLLLVSIFRWVFFTPVIFLLQKQPRKPHAILLLVLVGLLQLAVLAFEVDGFYIEPSRLTVTELPVSAPTFFPNRPLRILQISDLHVERTTPLDLAVLSQANSLQPDIIVLTGDYLNSSYTNNPLTIQETHQLLSQLHAPYGIFAVNGNTDTPATMSVLFEGLPNIRVLNDDVVPVRLPAGTIYIVGLSMTRSGNLDAHVLVPLMTEIPPHAYSVLLYHTSTVINTASTKGVDLFLSGHTHGGQVRLPYYGAIFTNTYYGKKYEMGEYQVGPTTLYVSRGIGMGGGLLPRIRFLCPPELVLVELGK